MTHRRDLLRLAATAGAGALISQTASAQGADPPPAGHGHDMPGDQARFAALYDLDRSIASFDAAYYGPMTRAVQAAYAERLGWVNRRNASFLRDAVAGHGHDAELDAVRAAVGAMIGAGADEIALSSGGTESLYALIVNYRRLRPGDQVILADVDYDEMQFAMTYLETSRQAQVVRLALPEPSTEANILAAYEAVLRASPRARLLLLTHLSNRHGVVPPVREIIALARSRGVDVILDSAQAFAQLPFTVEDTGADFIGFSLHKWLGAPLGTGAVYVRRTRRADIAPWLGNRIYDEADVRARIPSGTIDFAARLTVPEAIGIHQAIGPDRKLAHLRGLRDYWIERVRDIAGLQILLPQTGPHHGATAAFRLPGMGDLAATRRAQKRLLDRHRLLVVAKPGLASGPVLRVTPALFNTTGELDRLVDAIHAERALFA